MAGRRRLCPARSGQHGIVRQHAASCSTQHGAHDRTEFARGQLCLAKRHGRQVQDRRRRAFGITILGNTIPACSMPVAGAHITSSWALVCSPTSPVSKPTSCWNSPTTSTGRPAHQGLCSIIPSLKHLADALPRGSAAQQPPADRVPYVRSVVELGGAAGTCAIRGVSWRKDRVFHYLD